MLLYLHLIATLKAQQFLHSSLAQRLGSATIKAQGSQCKTMKMYWTLANLSYQWAVWIFSYNFVTILDLMLVESLSDITFATF